MSCNSNNQIPILFLPKNEPKNPKQMKGYHFWTNSPSIPKWTTMCKCFIITVYVAGLQILVHNYGTSFLIKHSELEVDKFAQILVFPEVKNNRNFEIPLEKKSWKPVISRQYKSFCWLFSNKEKFLHGLWGGQGPSPRRRWEITLLRIAAPAILSALSCVSWILLNLDAFCKMFWFLWIIIS